MLRVFTSIAVGLTLACAFALYAVSYDTRNRDLAAQSQERRAERLRSEIAVLRAERAYLSRPERIEPAARSLGLMPAQGHQYVRLDSLSNGSRPSSP